MYYIILHYIHINNTELARSTISILPSFLQAYNSFGQDSNTDDNNQWLEFLNPPSEKIEGEVGALTFHDDNNRSSDFLAADRLEFLEDEEKIKSEEHSYSLCKEDDDGDDDAGMNAFKLHFDGGWLDGWMDGWIDGWMDGWLDGWMDGWMDG